MKISKIILLLAIAATGVSFTASAQATQVASSMPAGLFVVTGSSGADAPYQVLAQQAESSALKQAENRCSDPVQVTPFSCHPNRQPAYFLMAFCQAEFMCH